MKILFISILVIMLMGCGDAKHNSSGKNNIAGITEKEIITFTDIQPLLEQKCSECHNEESSLFNVLDYEESFSKIDEINNRVVVIKDMPQIISMTDKEREVISRWIEDGGLLSDGSPPSDKKPPGEEEPPDEEEPNTEITFNKIIKPLFELKCALCHNAESGLLNVLDHEAVKARLEAIKIRVSIVKDMPQFGSMTEKERELVALWVDQGGM